MLLESRSRNINARRQSRYALIFISAGQHVLISDNLLVRKNYFDFNIIWYENLRILQRFSTDYLRQTSPEAHVYMRCHQDAKCKHFDINDVIYHKFSHAPLPICSMGKMLTSC